MALGSTQPLVKMSTRNIPGGKGCRCVTVTTSPPLSAELHEKHGSLNLLEPSGPVTGLFYLYLYIANTGLYLDRTVQCCTEPAVHCFQIGRYTCISCDVRSNDQDWQLFYVIIIGRSSRIWLIDWLAFGLEPLRSDAPSSYKRALCAP